MKCSGSQLSPAGLQDIQHSGGGVVLGQGVPFVLHLRFGVVASWRHSRSGIRLKPAGLTRPHVPLTDGTTDDTRIMIVV